MVTLQSNMREQVREERWCEFLKGLSPEERLVLFRDEIEGEGMELALHDMYVTGLWTLSQVKLMITVDASERAPLWNDSDPRD
jgi:hypothetical protein